jgi:hypothetical protein
MAQPAAQSYENHVRFVPGYHMVLFSILLINLIWSAYKTIRYFSFDALVSLLLAIGLIMMSFYVRIFALAVQDRVIRLEMRLRMATLFSPELRGRIEEFTPGQLVALRFASDDELPELAARVLAQNIVDKKAIKKMIKRWNPDYLRA